MTNATATINHAAPLPMPQAGRALARHGIIHEVFRCLDGLSDTAAFCTHFNTPLSRSANTIVVTWRKLRAQLNAKRANIADAEPVQGLAARREAAPGPEQPGEAPAGESAP